jgi:uncharacterized protein (UPF0210 family)
MLQLEDNVGDMVERFGADEVYTNGKKDALTDLIEAIKK